MADQFKNRLIVDRSNISLEEFKSNLWSNVPVEEYEDPPKEWIPEDQNYRFEWEEIDKKTKSKGRPVVLRARDSKEWQEAFEELDNANSNI